MSIRAHAGGALIGVSAPFVAVIFLGRALTFTVVYVWARRNPHVRLSLFGIFTFTAPYLPWVLAGFSMLLGHNPTDDFLGIAAGHAYFYLEDVLPRISRGMRPLATPWLLRAAFGEVRLSAAPRAATPAVTVERAPMRVDVAPAVPPAPQGHAHIQ